MPERAVKLHPSWREPLIGEFEQPYMQALKTFLAAERAAGGSVGSTLSSGGHCSTIKSRSHSRA